MSELSQIAILMVDLESTGDLPEEDQKILDELRAKNIIPAKGKPPTASNMAAFGRGAMDFAQGLKQISKDIFSSKEEALRYTKQVDEEIALFEKGRTESTFDTPIGPIDPFRVAGNIAAGYGPAGLGIGALAKLAPKIAGGSGILSRFANKLVPEFASRSPATSAAITKFLPKVGASAGASAVGGGTAFVPEGGSRLKASAISAALGPLAQGAGTAVARTVGTGVRKSAKAAQNKLRRRSINADKRNRLFPSLNRRTPIERVEDVLKEGMQDNKLIDKGLPFEVKENIKEILIRQMERGGKMDFNSALKEADLLTLPGGKATPGLVGTTPNPKSGLSAGDVRADTLATEGSLAGGPSAGARRLGKIIPDNIAGLNQRARELVEKFGPRLTTDTAGKQVRKSTSAKFNTFKNETDAAYSAARASIGNDFKMDPNPFRSKLDGIIKDNADVMNPKLIDRITDVLTPENFSVFEAEKLRKLINRRIRSTANPDGKRALRKTRDALLESLDKLTDDDSVAAGLYQQANNLARDQAKFSDLSVVDSVMKRGANPAKIDKLVRNSSVDDLDEFLNAVPDARDPISSRVAQTLEKSTGNVNEFNSTALQNKISEIGDEKIGRIFGKPNSEKVDTLVRTGNVIKDAPGEGVPTDFGIRGIADLLNPVAQLPGAGAPARAGQIFLRGKTNAATGEAENQAIKRTLGMRSGPPDVQPNLPGVLASSAGVGVGAGSAANRKDQGLDNQGLNNIIELLNVFQGP